MHHILGVIRQTSQTTQQTRDIDPMLHQCCATVYDNGLTMVKQWVDVSCLPGHHGPSLAGAYFLSEWLFIRESYK